MCYCNFSYIGIIKINMWINIMITETKQWRLTHNTKSKQYIDPKNGMAGTIDLESGSVLLLRSQARFSLVPI
jgi:hypothetical protein